jgi:hypothetical protein
MLEEKSVEEMMKKMREDQKVLKQLLLQQSEDLAAIKKKMG